MAPEHTAKGQAKKAPAAAPPQDQLKKLADEVKHAGEGGVRRMEAKARGVERRA